MKKGTIYPLPLISFTPQNEWTLLSETENHLSLYMMHIINNSNVPVEISFDSLEGHALCMPFHDMHLTFPVYTLDIPGLTFTRIYAKSFYIEGPSSVALAKGDEVVGRCTLSSFIMCRGA